MYVGIRKYNISVVVYGVKISYVGIVKFGDNNFRYNYFVLGDPFLVLV